MSPFFLASLPLWYKYAAQCMQLDTWRQYNNGEEERRRKIFRSESRTYFMSMASEIGSLSVLLFDKGKY